MPADPKTPFSVLFCKAMIRGCAQFVPAAQREEWRQEWFGEIWHRWQFLRHAGVWNGREALRLFRDTLGAFPDACWHFAAQETVRDRVRACARSPWTCLGILSALLLLVGLLSSGFAATRQLFRTHSSGSGNLLFIWLHPVIGGTDRGVPPDLVPAWRTNSRLLESVAPFSISKARLSTIQPAVLQPLIINTEASLFEVVGATPSLGRLPETPTSVAVLDHNTWRAVFHSNPRIIGSEIKLGSELYPIAAVLPASFQFLTRQPSIYLVNHQLTERRVMVVARAKPGTDKRRLDRELTKIAQDITFYFLAAQLRFSFVNGAVLTPLVFFGVAALASALLVLLMMCRVSLHRVRIALAPEHRNETLRRASFFTAKIVLGSLVVFTAGLEWSRSESSILFASQDPANGPLLVWLYILGTMGLFFWALADQRARCRVCLRLLCFPVRIGCPGCLLLDWSGTELLCTEGHGVLHVPHLAPSWDEESEHWISLDDSWRDLFVNTK